MDNKGSIEIVCGPMFSGKTEELLRKMNRLHYAKIDYIVFKPQIDNRYDAQKVVSHNKSSMKAVLVNNAYDVLKHCEAHPNIKHIGIDEIQFLPSEDPFNAFKLCLELKKRGYKIYASGLDMDFRGMPFGIMGELLAIADSVEKLKSVCHQCGADAGMSSKMTESLDLIDVGTTDKYEAHCYHHWLEAQKQK